MLFVAIAEHSPAQCPGSSKEVFDLVNTAIQKVSDVEQKHAVKNLGVHVMLGAHKIVVIMDAPSFDAAEAVLLESHFLTWNTVQMSRAYTPQEAMKMSQAAA